MLLAWKDQEEAFYSPRLGQALRRLRRESPPPWLPDHGGNLLGFVTLGVSTDHGGNLLGFVSLGISTDHGGDLLVDADSWF